MAELLGLGCSHGPIILTPPEVWAKGRERIFARVPGYEAPEQLLKELGDDNGLSRDISDQKKIVDSFKVMRDRLHEWEPDVVVVIGDDQAENFLQDTCRPSACTRAPRSMAIPSSAGRPAPICGTRSPKRSSRSGAPRSFPRVSATS